MSSLDKMGKIALVKKKCRMYSAPNKSNPLHLLHPMDTLSVDEIKDNWCSITDPYGRKGFIKISKLVLIERGTTETNKLNE